MTATATAEVTTDPGLRMARSGEGARRTPRFVRARAGAAPDWDGYLAELRRDIDEVHLKLSFAERHLSGGADARFQSALAPALGIEHDRWLRAVGRLEALAETGSPPPPRPVLEALGRDRGRVRIGARTMELSPRHTEILALLANHPAGMTTAALALALYGDMGRPGSLRTELHRLRKALAGLVRTDGNLLTLDIEADFLVIQRLLRAGRTREAAERYRAPLLPRSEAPGVVDDRGELDAWVRSAVMTAGDQEALWAWLESESGCEDVPAWKRFLAGLDFGDPRRPLAVSRLSVLRTTLALVS